MAVELTVIVKGEDGSLLEGANVRVTPGDVQAVTNTEGEAKLTVDGADRFQVTVSNGDSQQTVPFYVIEKQQSAKLEVNLQYFKQLNEAKKEQVQVVTPTPWYQTDAAYAGYGIAAIVLIAIIVAAVIKRKHQPEVYPRTIEHKKETEPSRIEVREYHDESTSATESAQAEDEVVSISDVVEELAPKPSKSGKKTKKK